MGWLPAMDGSQLLRAPVNWPASPRPDGERPAEVVRVQADADVNRMFIAGLRPDRRGARRRVGRRLGRRRPDRWPLTGPAPAGRSVMITAACRLGDALDKGVSPLSDIHGDRRPELYRRVTG